MIDSFIRKQPGFVVIFATHMIINVQSQANITGTCGSNITLKFTFTFPNRIQNNSHIMVHKMVTQPKKVAEYWPGSNGEGFFNLDPENNSVIWHITFAKLNDSGVYSASLVDSEVAQKGSTLVLIIQEANTNSTVPPGQNSLESEENEDWRLGFGDTMIVAISVITLIVLMSAILTYLIWSLYRVKDMQEQQNQQRSPPTVQETVSSASAGVPSVVYMVLEFPKRASMVSDNNPDCTEYAHVNYTKKM